MQCVVPLTCVPSVFAESVVRSWVEHVHCITTLVRLRPGLVLAVCLCMRQLCDSDLRVCERQARCTTLHTTFALHAQAWTLDQAPSMATGKLQRPSA